MAIRLTCPRVGVDQDGYRPVVYQVDLHHSLKYAGFYWHRSPPRTFDKVVVKIEGLLRRRGLVETGPPAPAAIAVERELRNHQKGSSCLLDIAIHLAGLIRKDA